VGLSVHLRPVHYPLLRVNSSRFGKMMKWREKIGSTWRNAIGGAAFCVLVGLASRYLWVCEGLVFLSYDLPFYFFNARPPNDTIIIYMDDTSFTKLGQRGFPTWDRKLHAGLLDRLSADGCKLVVFDIVFDDPGTPEANARFARAIRKNRRVVLAAAINFPSRQQISVRQLRMPLPEFQEAAAGWGVAELDIERSPRRVARMYYAGSELEPSLPQAAADLVGAGSTKAQKKQAEEKWLNYYGPAVTFEHISYCDVTNTPSGHFRNKVVFIGVRPKLLKAEEEADSYRTPYTLWTDQLTPGVEITATAFANLMRNDGWNRAPVWVDVLLMLAGGLVFGSTLVLLRPLAAGGVALLGAVLILFAGLQAASHRVWFAWSAVAMAQIPCALAWSLRCHFHRVKFEKEVVTRTLEQTTKLVEATKATARQKPAQMIPDHALVKRVGKGAYGEVWLARNAVGVYHAAKIVQRRGFPADEPYEREFRGIQKFMPVSRSHPGFVHILHVGRNDDERYFFCVMEAGDDKTAGQRIDPETYSPMTLATELEWRGKLSAEACLKLGLSLTLALEHLHQSQLIHRDIKPSNIIYVNGAPKFADIGLVTDIRSASHDVSFLGTEGYIAPEGPGTASADVYALGKVLYEAAMGRDRRLFPEVPTAVLEEPSEGLLRRLNEVIFKACEMAANDRYQTAGEMHADLLALQSLVKQLPR